MTDCTTRLTVYSPEMSGIFERVRPDNADGSYLYDKEDQWVQLTGGGTVLKFNLPDGGAARVELEPIYTQALRLAGLEVAEGEGYKPEPPSTNYVLATFRQFGRTKTSHRGDYYITAEFLLSDGSGHAFQSFVPGRHLNPIISFCRLVGGDLEPLNTITADSPPWDIEEAIEEAFKGCSGKEVTLERTAVEVPQIGGTRRQVFSHRVVPTP